MSQQDMGEMPEQFDPMQFFRQEAEMELSQMVFALLAADRIEEAAAAANLAAELLPEIDLAESLMELFDEHPDIRARTRGAFAGRADLPDSVAESMN